MGRWTATVISKKFIITAKHIGAKPGNVFRINGENHRTVSSWSDPNSDLQIFQTVGSYYFAAPLFKDTTEVGRSVVLYGRGGTRGEEVSVNGHPKGWKWTTQDGVLSWGRNAISNVVSGGVNNSSLLKFNFDPNGTTYEGTVTGGDSGGGVFIKQGTAWRLAGVNFSADGQFSYNQDGSDSFNAAIFDRTELWTQGYGFAQAGNPIPTAAYATRISSRIPWIFDVLNGRIAADPPAGTRGYGGGLAPEPATSLIAATFAVVGLLRPRRRACR